MNTTKTLTDDQKDLCKRFYDDTHIDLEWPIINEDDITDIDTLTEYLEERAGEIEVIYYARAMEYLAENDPSLCESIEIAHEYGYETKSINSELLATLLQQREALEAIGKYKDELEEVFFPEVIEEECEMCKELGEDECIYNHDVIPAQIPKD